MGRKPSDRSVRRLRMWLIWDTAALYPQTTVWGSPRTLLLFICSHRCEDMWPSYGSPATHKQMERPGTPGACLLPQSSPRAPCQATLDMGNFNNGLLIVHSVLDFTASSGRRQRGLSLIDHQRPQLICLLIKPGRPKTACMHLISTCPGWKLGR